MIGAAYVMPINESWKIKSPSNEYLSLPEDEKNIIEANLSDLPVKLGALANSLGIRVLLSTLPRGISGKISYESGSFVIRVNRHEAKHRQRFTLAHEIAHFLLHRDKIIEAGEWTENALLRSGQPAKIEYEANRLASDLVIPSNLLRWETTHFDGPLTSEAIEELARKFGVSVAAMEIKLKRA